MRAKQKTCKSVGVTNERLKTKSEGSTRLPYTRLCGGLEHLKIETRSIDERFVSLLFIINR